jgi:16S rRNA processing protein RimM
VAVEPRTDVPELRFADGVLLRTEPADRGPLTVAGSRWHSGRLLIRFAGVDDRGSAEQLRGISLLIDRASLGDPGPEAWWDHDLAGLRAETPSGGLLGTVSDVLHAPAQDLLSITTPDGREVLVPFVVALVPIVDLSAGRVVIDPPAGLFEL